MRMKPALFGIISFAVILIVLQLHLIDPAVYHIRSLFDATLSEEEVMLERWLSSDPTTLLQSYAKYLREHPERTKVCHGLLHQIGHEAVESLGWQRTMEISDALCGGGFIHGAIEAHFGLLKTVLSPELVAEQIALACGDSSNEICYHGIGHGLMVLLENDDEQALRHCGSIDLPGRMDCHDGVFMHIFDAEETGVPKESPRRIEAAAFCGSVTEEEKLSCFFYLPRLFAQSASMVQNAIDLCELIEIGWQRTTCAEGAGHMFLKYTLPDREKAMYSCSLFSPSLRASCESGARSYQKLQESTTGML
ncbi:MAG: hypothetical protein ABL890_02545 [Candidatus Peribacteraceae bacterium]